MAGKGTEGALILMIIIIFERRIEFVRSLNDVSLRTGIT